MNAWLDTETKAILQRSPPDKIAPPDTGPFALVLLATQRESRERLVAAVERVRETTRDEVLKILAQPLPAVVKWGLSHEDALLGQFEFIACDAISVFLANEVVYEASKGYLNELYASVRRSPEFELVSVRIESLPDDAKGKEFLDRFVGVAAPQIPLEMTAMWKKARIMEHWAAKIGGELLVRPSCPEKPNVQTDSIAGAILGCALGDAIGLPYEGLSKRRGVRLLGEPDRLRFVFRHGMVSDDTEHTCMVAQSLCECPHDADAFARSFARRLRWWLLGVPAGIGLATLRAIVRLWFGFSPQRSGVFSAGNGPAMRSAILGAAIDDLETLERFVHASTVITHSDPKAFHGAFAVAVAAWCAKRGVDSADGFFRQYHSLPGYTRSDECNSLLLRVEQSLASGESTEVFAQQIGCARGVSGYVYHTVPIALHAWLTHPRDFGKAVAAVIRCGGDTDTTGAIIGAIVGSGIGRAGLPRDWLSRLWEWPRSVAWMERMADATNRAVSSDATVLPPRVVPIVGILRNAVFLAIVLAHVLRRLLPPY